MIMGKSLNIHLLRDIDSNKEYIVNSEVKTLTCDPFIKESGLKIIDGQKLIKPLDFSAI